MKTKKTLILEADESGFAAAGDIIRRGGLVVFPTETVYGLGANALDAAACAGIFAAKGRPQDNPLIVHTADVFALARLTRDIPPRAAALIQAFMPGPLTLILPKTQDIPDAVTAGLPTVGLRVPSDAAAAGFLRHAGVPVAGPSANLSGRLSPTTFAMAREAMEGRADAIIRAEDSRVGLESTIARVSESGIEILRPGGVSEEAIRAVIQDCPVRGAFSENPDDPPPAPGMKYTHYKPRAEVFLYKSGSRITEAGGKKTGVITLTGKAASFPRAFLVREAASPEDYARRLYADFFVFDSLGCEIILAEYPPEEGIGRAVANRLLKASGGRFV
ncbi:MAG: threonylcarbamoyl-AMP synthase [Spirochaetales bacterium]|jgi:L-threonylcarbamoyladenylate synthase|nr:threonylcarbamoyl-AMP synthase [Spirochaetales bacterium]